MRSAQQHVPQQASRLHRLAARAHFGRPQTGCAAGLRVVRRWLAQVARTRRESRHGPRSDRTRPATRGVLQVEVASHRDRSVGRPVAAPLAALARRAHPSSSSSPSPCCRASTTTSGQGRHALDRLRVSVTSHFYVEPTSSIELPSKCRWGAWRSTPARGWDVADVAPRRLALRAGISRF